MPKNCKVCKFPVRIHYTTKNELCHYIFKKICNFFETFDKTKIKCYTANEK